MRPPHHILDRKRAYRLAAEHLQEHLQFKDYKRKTSAQVLWSLLLAAAARITSLSETCQRLRDAPSDETARKALLATLPDYGALQRQLNAALAGHLPKTLRTHLQRLAIDLTLIPYHGLPFEKEGAMQRQGQEDGRGQPLPGQVTVVGQGGGHVVDGQIGPSRDAHPARLGRSRIVTPIRPPRALYVPAPGPGGAGTRGWH